MSVFERGEVEHTRLRGHKRRYFGIAPRRSIDGGRVGIVARRHTDTGTPELAILCLRIMTLLGFFCSFLLAGRGRRMHIDPRL